METTQKSSPFLQACRKEKTSHTPIWLMRQAGRYMPEYREIRSKVGFLELCKRPELAAEVTVHAAKALEVDAAILFADILLITEPMGLNLEFTKGDGPVIHNPIRVPKDLERLRDPEPSVTLSYVMEAIRLCRKDLPSNIPLIGFSGAPFTVASYMIEGGASRNFEHTKALMRTDAGVWNELLAYVTRSLSAYLCAQVKAGAQALQVFDSWIGALSPEDYRTYVLPHMKQLFASLPKEVPTIHFGTGTGLFLEDLKSAGGDVIGVDFHISLADAWKRLGDVAVQGNLDPTTLLCPRDVLLREAKKVMDEAAGRPGHIFNLGHGILPTTPVDNAKALVDFVHTYRATA